MSRVSADVEPRLDLQLTGSMVSRCLNALEDIRRMAAVWESQPTDYDEDTEQQISDGRELMFVLRRYGL